MAATQTQRRGDRRFARLAQGAGTTILVVLALVATFLIVMAIPALIAAPATLAIGGYGSDGFWAWVWPFAFGTLWSSLWALLFAVPVSVGVALFLTHYAPKRLASTFSYLVDLLAAVPSVVFGLWGILVLAPFLQPFYAWLGSNLGWFPLFAGAVSGSGRTLLTAALVLAIMMLPIITALCREVFRQVPRLHEEAALALGATRFEMIRLAVLPFAKSGIISATMLGLGRALGETMAVAMVLSGSAEVTVALLTSTNPNTIAAQIAQNFPEASGLRINQLIAAGLVLFVVTLAVNMVARAVVARRAEFSGAN